MFVRACLCVRHDTDLPEPALVGVTYAFWHADIETDGDLGRLYRVEFNKVLCVSDENRGWIGCNGIQKAVTV